VSSVGLGELFMSIEGRPDESQSIATILAALDAGVRLIDTADAYCLGPLETGHGERLVAQALRLWNGNPEEVLVCTKGGQYRPGDGSWQVDARPERLRLACEMSLHALGVEAIGLYYLHRPDPNVPYAESVGALKELLDEGKIRMAGVSNTDVIQIETAREVLGTDALACVQNEFSPGLRASEVELRHCMAHGIAFVPWSPFGRIRKDSDLASAYPAFGFVADAHDVSVHQIVLAWILSKGDQIIPIPGASRPETILDSVKAADLELTATQIATLDSSNTTAH